MLHKIVKCFKPYVAWTITCMVISYIEHSIVLPFESFTEVAAPTAILGVFIGFMWDVYVNDLFGVGDKL